jgi:hypothetical protein
MSDQQLGKGNVGIVGPDGREYFRIINLIRFARVVLFVCLIVFYVIVGWKLRDLIFQGKSDFISYFTASKLALSGQAHSLYDLGIQEEFQKQILQDLGSNISVKDGLLPYIHPPFEVVWFMPLAKLAYVPAFLVWVGVSLSCFGAGTAILLRSCNRTQLLTLREALLGTMAFLPLLATLLQGQDTAMVFFFLAMAFHDLRTSREFRSGIWISLCLQRFQLLPLFLLIFLFKKRWKILAGFGFGGIVLGLISLALVGATGIAGYSTLLIQMIGWVDKYGIHPSQMDCLKGQFCALWPNGPLKLVMGATLFVSLSFTALLLFAWRGKWDVRSMDFSLRFSFLVIVSLMVSPHVNFHDLSLLIIPGILMWAAVRSSTNPTILDRWLVGMTFFVGFPIILATQTVFSLFPVKLDVLGLCVTASILYWRLRNCSPDG